MQFAVMKHAHKIEKLLVCSDASLKLIHYYQDTSFFIRHSVFSIEVSGHLQYCSSIKHECVIYDVFGRVNTFFCLFVSYLVYMDKSTDFYIFSKPLLFHI